MKEDPEFLARLRAGDEACYSVLIRRYHAAMAGLAQTYVKSRDSAEEVAQDTWMAVLNGLKAFEGRSSLKTWIFSILVNKAKTRAAREGRTVLFSEMKEEGAPPEPAVDPSRFKRSGHWAVPPRSWNRKTPERLLHNSEMRSFVEAALSNLPDAQRAVVILRDVEGCSSLEACNILGLSETNQRVLLHRGRSRIRAALEEKLSALKDG